MKAFKRILLGLVSLLLCNIGFPQTTEFDSQPKFQANSETEEQINKSMFQGYVEISQYGVNFNKSGFENNVLLPLKGVISDEEYESYEKQCSYLDSTAKAMTELAQQGEGIIKSDGTFCPLNNVTSEIVTSDIPKAVNDIVTEYPKIEEPDSLWMGTALKEAFIKEFNWNLWTGLNILYGPVGTTMMGLFGMIINIANFALSFKGALNLSHTTYEILTQGLLGNPTLFESDLERISSFLTNNTDAVLDLFSGKAQKEVTDGLPEDEAAYMSFAFCMIGIGSLLRSHPAYWIVRLILSVVSLYLPDFATGILMFVYGFQFHDCRAVITSISSNYSIIK